MRVLSRFSLRFSLGLALVSSLAACKRSENSEAEAESAAQDSAEANVAQGNTAEEPQDPTLAELAAAISHEEAPTPADLAVDVVDGTWATFRGDEARSGLRDAPSIKNPRIAWSRNLGIMGYGSTVISGDDLLLVGTKGAINNRPRSEDVLQGVYSLDPSTGATRWFVPTSTDTNAMTLEDGVLYVGTDAGELIAIDASSGAKNWTVDGRCGIFAPPFIHDGFAWLIRRDGVVWVDVNNGDVLGDLDNCRSGERGGFSAVGDEVWASAAFRLPERWTTDGLAYTMQGEHDNRRRLDAWLPPLMTESLVIQAWNRWIFEDGRREGIVAFWRDNGQAIWQIDLSASATNEFPMEGETPFHRALPWLNGTKLYTTPINRGAIVVWNALTGEEQATIDLPDCRRRQFSSMVGTNDTGYLARHDGVLYAFDTESDTLTWRLHLGLHGMAGQQETHQPVPHGCTHLPDDSTALFATPTIAEDGTLYVGSGDGWLYAIRDQEWPVLGAAAAEGEAEGAATPE